MCSTSWSVPEARWAGMAAARSMLPDSAAKPAVAFGYLEEAAPIHISHE